MTPYYADDAVTLYAGDCLKVMAGIEADSVDAIVCDPPYGLAFMGKSWDHGVPGVPFWLEAFRVAKPGAHLVAFGGTRTYHRLACAIEDAGWEIRDCLMWLYGSGFPKSTRVNRDPRFCQCGEVARNESSTGREQAQASHIGTGAASYDDDLRREDARRSSGTREDSTAHCSQDSDRYGESAPSAEVDGRESSQQQEYALGRSRYVGRVDAPDVGSSRSPSTAPRSDLLSSPDSECHGYGSASVRCDTSPSIQPTRRTHSGNESPENRSDRRVASVSTWPYCLICGKPVADGLGSALKPAYEPVILARKPLQGTLSANVQAYGTGAINVDACRIGADWETDPNKRGWQGGNHRDGYDGSMFGNNGGAVSRPQSGRWPANLLLDAESAAALDAQTAHIESGASRYFYTAKADAEDRNDGCDGLEKRSAGDITNRKDGSAGLKHPRSMVGSARRNTHPTVKPTDLMRWLVRLVTTPGGVVLDPFMGSGSTGRGAVLEGARFVGIELTDEYLSIAQARIQAAQRVQRLPFTATDGTAEQVAAQVGLFDSEGVA